MKTVITLLSVLAVGASACYGPGERNQGASGYPAVPYKQCCDGQRSVEKPGDWGKFCPLTGTNGAGSEDTCYKPGEKNQGASGFPAVEYKPCCDGQSSVERAGEWGRFCPGAGTGGGVGTGDDTCYAAGERNQGASGFPAVLYKPCCDGQQSVVKADEWGRFCPAAATGGDGGGDLTCYGPGERNQGESGFPAVPYKPCCDGRGAVEKANDWGKFCPGEDTGGGGTTTTVVIPVTETTVVIPVTATTVAVPVTATTVVVPVTATTVTIPGGDNECRVRRRRLRL